MLCREFKSNGMSNCIGKIQIICKTFHLVPLKAHTLQLQPVLFVSSFYDVDR